MPPWVAGFSKGSTAPGYSTAEPRIDPTIINPPAYTPAVMKLID
jgi:hypothetical protein